jgi:hypothetical protein
VLFVPDEVPPIVFFPTVGAADPRYAVLFVLWLRRTDDR